MDVAVSGHRGFVPLDDYDIVHVHHLGKAALAMAAASTRSMFIYTGHDGRLINGYAASRRRKLATGFVTARADALVALSDFESRLMQATARVLRPQVGDNPLRNPDRHFLRPAEFR